jgi:hypothetical protein
MTKNELSEPDEKRTFHKKKKNNNKEKREERVTPSQFVNNMTNRRTVARTIGRAHSSDSSQSSTQ